MTVYAALHDELNFHQHLHFELEHGSEGSRNQRAALLVLSQFGHFIAIDIFQIYTTSTVDKPSKKRISGKFHMGDRN
jgi:hypothetical protein